MGPCGHTSRMCRLNQRRGHCCFKSIENEGQNLAGMGVREGKGWTFEFLAPRFPPHDPKLAERRLRRQEKAREQRMLMRVFHVTVMALFLLPGLDHRFGWSHLPLWLTILSQTIVFGGWVMMYWVMKVNRFAASTIEVEPGQCAISTGRYSIVRHPMYLGAGVMLLFSPLALGSYFALPAIVLLVPVIVLRLLNEEKILRQELPGYAEYCLHPRFRLVPLFW
jgi:protein-S-isoprenylcysteine O-methyltransferase Ste14